MTPRRLLILCVLLSTALAPLAHAQGDDDEPEEGTHEDPEPEVAVEGAVWDRVLAVSATVGLDTPLGIAGAALEVTPFRFLAIYAGVGVGRDGLRIAGGVRPQFPMGNGALGILIGLTGGPLDWNSRGDDMLEIHRWWEFALFFHSGVSFEYRWDEGVFGRLAFGVEALIEPSSATECNFVESGESCNGASLFTPVRGWAGLTVGYAFDL